MTNHKVWVDPKDCGLTVVETAERKRREDEERKRKEEAERQRREAERKQKEEAERLRAAQARAEAERRKKEEEERAKTQVHVIKAKGEILPPSEALPVAADTDAIALPRPPVNITPQLDAVVTRFEDLLETAFKSFDLRQPEGFIDTWICDRPHHRLEVKVERSTRAVQLLENFEKALAAAERVDKTIRRRNRIGLEEYVELVRLKRTVLEETHRLQLAQAAVARKELIEDAATRETLACHEANIRAHALRGYAPPPPPPPPPAPPPPEDPRPKNKARLQAEIERLQREEAAEIKKTTGGKPEHEWSESEKEEVARIENMYADARDAKREELRGCL